jgi:hypothetical protein
MNVSSIVSSLETAFIQLRSQPGKASKTVIPHRARPISRIALLSRCPCGWCNGNMDGLKALKAEMKLLTWLMGIDMALILACLAIAVLREFG